MSSVLIFILLEQPCEARTSLQKQLSLHLLHAKDKSLVCCHGLLHKGGAQLASSSLGC
jgi:hypothetical protein